MKTYKNPYDARDGQHAEAARLYRTKALSCGGNTAAIAERDAERCSALAARLHGKNNHPPRFHLKRKGKWSAHCRALDEQASRQNKLWDSDAMKRIFSRICWSAATTLLCQRMNGKGYREAYVLACAQVIALGRGYYETGGRYVGPSIDCARFRTLTSSAT